MTVRTGYVRSKLLAGAHGAKIGIMGRRQEVINASAQQLCSEGLKAIGLQVSSALGHIKQQMHLSNVAHARIQTIMCRHSERSSALCHL